MNKYHEYTYIVYLYINIYIYIYISFSAAPFFLLCVLSGPRYGGSSEALVVVDAEPGDMRLGKPPFRGPPPTNTHPHFLPWHLQSGDRFKGTHYDQLVKRKSTPPPPLQPSFPPSIPPSPSPSLHGSLRQDLFEESVLPHTLAGRCDVGVVPLFRVSIYGW